MKLDPQLLKERLDLSWKVVDHCIRELSSQGFHIEVYGTHWLQENLLLSADPFVRVKETEVREVK